MKFPKRIKGTNKVKVDVEDNDTLINGLKAFLLEDRLFSSVNIPWNMFQEVKREKHVSFSFLSSPGLRAAC